MGAASSMATGRAAITFNRAAVSKLTTVFNNLRDLNKVTDYIVVNENTKTGKLKEEPLSFIQRYTNFSAKGHRIVIYIQDINYSDSHGIKCIVEELGKFKQ